MNPYARFQMPLAEAMTTQRAIRRIKPDPIDDELLLEVIELATKAPTAQDGQAWEFIIVKDVAVKAALARLSRFMWRLYAPVARRKGNKNAAHARMYKAAQWGLDHFEEIPVYVVACYRGLLLTYPPVLGSSAYGSIFPAVQNLLLAARAAGLGANLTTLPLWSSWLARRALGLPRGLTPCAVIPLGWPIGRYGPTTRRPIEEVVSLDRYGNRAWLDDARS